MAEFHYALKCSVSITADINSNLPQNYSKKHPMSASDSISCGTSSSGFHIRRAE